MLLETEPDLGVTDDEGQTVHDWLRRDRKKLEPSVYTQLTELLERHSRELDAKHASGTPAQ